MSLEDSARDLLGEHLPLPYNVVMDLLQIRCGGLKKTI